jgi:hypothetical protein
MNQISALHIEIYLGFQIKCPSEWNKINQIQKGLTEFSVSPVYKVWTELVQ